MTHPFIVEAFDKRCECAMCQHARGHGRDAIERKSKAVLDEAFDQHDILVEELIDNRHERRERDYA